MTRRSAWRQSSPGAGHFAGVSEAPSAGQAESYAWMHHVYGLRGSEDGLGQVTAALRRAGRPTPAFHPIELVDASIRGLSPDQLLQEARR